MQRLVQSQLLVALFTCVPLSVFDENLTKGESFRVLRGLGFDQINIVTELSEMPRML
jgi:hypothetical protein